MKQRHTSFGLLAAAFTFTLVLASIAVPTVVREKVDEQALRDKVLTAARDCSPRPGMSRAELLVFWPESHDGNFRHWRGRSREEQYNAIDLENTNGPGSVRITLSVKYQNGKVESASLRLPDMMDAEVFIDSQHVKLPNKKSDAEVLKDSLELLTRLTQDLKSRGWKVPNNPAHATGRPAPDR